MILKYLTIATIFFSVVTLSNATNNKEITKKTHNKELVTEQKFDFENSYTNIIKGIYEKFLDDNKTNLEIKKDLTHLNKLSTQEKKNIINLINKKEIQNDIIFTFECMRGFDKTNKYLKAFMEDKTIPEMTNQFTNDFELYWSHKKIFYEIFIEEFLNTKNSNDLKYQLTEKGLKKFKFSYVESMKYYEYDIVVSNNINISNVNKLYNSYKDKTFWEYFTKI